MSQLPEIKRIPFTEALEAGVSEARAEESNLGLLLVDLTNLTTINHYHGYEHGDRLLDVTFQQLLSVSKLPDTVFRIGSHHFAFILPGLSNPAFIALAMNKVQTVLDDSLFIDQDTVSVILKIGVAISHGGRRDAMATLAEAEESLLKLKRGGALQLQYLVVDQGAEHRDFKLDQLFSEAIHDNAFELYYQPKIHLTSDSVHCAEALLRWFPEGREPVPPPVIVDLANTSGRAYELAKWVVHTSVRQIKEWREPLGMSVALNLQADLVNHPDLCPLIEDAISLWGIDAESLTVEITESAIIEDKESGFDNLLRLKELGAGLSIDDFGTGYSSLSYFKHIPATELKIDRSFVERLTEDSQDLELVKIMIQIAHQFGLKVVAEGVEEFATLALLRDLGCDYIQGYFFSKPLPAAEFEDWARNWQGVEAFCGQAK